MSRGSHSRRQTGVAADRGDRAVSHRGWAQRAGLDLSLHQIARGARHVRPAAGIACPRGAVVAACRDALHQGVPRGMKLDRGDTLALHVEVVEHRRMAIGEPRMLEIGGGAECRTVARELPGLGAGTFPVDGRSQRLIGGEQVVVHQGRRLVQRRGRGRLRALHPAHGRPICADLTNMRAHPARSMNPGRRLKGTPKSRRHLRKRPGEC